MKRLIQILTSTVIVFLLPPFTFLLTGSDGWQRVKHKNNIDVYSRPVAQFHLNEFRGKCTINQPIESFPKIMLNFDHYQKWFAMCKNVHLIKKLSRNVYIVHYIVDSPWPLSDRDCEVRIRINFNKSKGTGYVFLESTNKGYIPASTKFIRIDRLNGSFIFKKISPEKTAVIFTMKVDPKINMSVGYQNNFLVSYPFNTLIGLKKIVSEKRP